jgi:phosphoribosyl 1,2-cyclic phosphodiesterase
VVIVDAGSGARDLGDALIQEFHADLPPLHLFLTHFHWDHIQGLPLFAPLFHPAANICFRASKTSEEIRGCLAGQMRDPYFPMPFEDLRSTQSFDQVFPGQPLSLGPITVTPFLLNHPQGAFGYRFEAGGAAFVHISDHEHGDPAVDAGVRRHAQGADTLVYDAQYTPREYEGKHGWGHSTYVEAARLAQDAGVKRLVLFHHDPRHDDAFLEAMLIEAKKHFSGTEMAREDSVLEI